MVIISYSDICVAYKNLYYLQDIILVYSNTIIGMTVNKPDLKADMYRKYLL